MGTRERVGVCEGEIWGWEQKWGRLGDACSWRPWIQSEEEGRRRGQARRAILPDSGALHPVNEELNLQRSDRAPLLVTYNPTPPHTHTHPNLATLPLDRDPSGQEKRH